MVLTREDFGTQHRIQASFVQHQNVAMQIRLQYFT